MGFDSEESVKEFLEEKYEAFCHTDFIADDPISIPHRYSRKEDVEISGFLSAIIAWGNRKSILKSAGRMMELMDNSPFDFVMHHKESDLMSFKGFVHRTFNAQDFMTIVQCLQVIYRDKGGLEAVFSSSKKHEDSLRNFPDLFFSMEVPERSLKHIARIDRNSAAKRLNMFLRWMVRKDSSGVDFGIWNKIRQADLFIPLDVHSGNSARKLGLLRRKQNDWKAVVELTERLKMHDPQDPVKYDFALFGMGVIEKIT